MSNARECRYVVEEGMTTETPCFHHVVVRLVMKSSIQNREYMKSEVIPIPDEILQAMENSIIERFTDRLKQLIFDDDRIPKAETLYIDMDINKAKKSYDKLYP